MLKLFNTLTRKVQEFKPIHDNQVGFYACGPTVYDYAHIGNLKTYICEDVLKRTLLADGFEVTHIMNITDVGHLTGDRDMGEDKIEESARRSRKSAWEIASFYTDAFLNDIKELNILLPDKLPKATDHIKDMIALIEELEKKGFTYKTSDGIYFDTSKLSDYGKLAQLDIEGLKEGARVEANPEKRNSTDFALWKFSSTPSSSPPYQGGEREGVAAKRQMEWKSPWGIGFPGWHIECSAMSAKYLGQPFDVHTGGVDHIPVHHTNEIAQSEAAFEKPLANFWMHSEFIMVDSGRMGKSEGNLVTLDELKKKGYSPLAFRYFVIGGHYRTKLNFSWQAMEGAQNSLNNLYSSITEYTAGGKISCAELEKEFQEAMNDDLDTPKALAVVWEVINSGNPPEAKLKSLFEFDKILGLSLRENWEELRKPLPDDIQKLVTQREQARAKKDFTKSDALRAEIEKLGVEVKDTEKGQMVRRKV
jgi:cysteinyl-tRNA synthetase